MITTFAAAALASCAIAAEYTLKGERWLRKYSADRATPVYNAQVDAAKIVNKLCNVAWERSSVESATLTYHDSTLLNSNVVMREDYDAALFCAHHVNSTHIAYANAACYRVKFEDGTLPRLTSLSVNVYSDPYNANGARIVLMTNDSGVIPTSCSTVRGDITGGIKATNVAKRVTVTSGTKETWYPSATNLVFGAEALGASGLQLRKYLFVFVLMENYSTTRGDWLEGSSYIDNEISVTTSAELPGNPSGSDVSEPHATDYMLNDGASAEDADGDGLSNYTEYLVSKVFGFTNLNANAYSTTNGVCDYFLRVGQMYLGEIFQDHDQIDDAWERKYSDSANMYVHDGDRDDDGDGWSNYAEFKAGTSPDDPSSYPEPTVRVKFIFNSKMANVGDVCIRAWSDSVDPYMIGSCAASWKVSKNRGTYFDWHEFSVSETEKSFGHLREGACSFIVWQDKDGGTSGTFDPGEPFGVVRGVDVGWQGASFTVELSETIAITPRFSFWASETSDRSATVNESIKMLLSDRTKQQDAFESAVADAETTIEESIDDQIEETNADEDKDRVRIRIVRFGVNDMFAYLLGVGFGDTDPNPIILDRTFDKNGRAYLCEADFLGENEFDLDWARLEKEVINNWGVIKGVDQITNMTYLAVFEGGEGHEYWIRGSYDTNTVIKASSTTIERRFELTKHAPVAQAVEGVCFAARPTFKWSLPNEEAFAKKYGTSYTAFKLKIFDGDNKVVYDSGLRRAPAQDSTGVFSWTADCSAGDLLATGERFAATGNYTWQVAMYNAKFKPVDEDKFYKDDSASAAASFSIAANATQEMNDHQYSSIDVCVKYAGPALVLGSYTDETTLTGKVRVQAFATADFAGEALSETIVTEKVDSYTNLTANARLVGLAAGGTYYLRAYIDSNGNHQRDAWESYGAAKEPVVLATSLLTTPLADVWIEDCDTDQDWLPDAWEYAKNGSIESVSATVRKGGITAIPDYVITQSVANRASLSRSLPGVSLTFFEAGTNSISELLGNWIDTSSTNTFDTIRNAVETSNE